MDLPLPLRPTNATVWPGGTTRFRSLMTCRSPYAKRTSSTLITDHAPRTAAVGSLSRGNSTFSTGVSNISKIRAAAATPDRPAWKRVPSRRSGA